MKKILIVFALAAFTTAFAQENKNEKTETTTTKTYVKDSKGVDVDTKEVTTKEDQVIALNNTSADKTNFSTKMLPSEVKTDVNFKNNERKFSFEAQDKGYRMMAIKDDTSNEFATIRPSSQKGYYIYSQDGDNSFGYFNQNGNFVVERYDPNTDSIVTTVYKLEVQEQTMKKKNKMK
tara:strand:- start:394 stop:924 length:531 start_codon:yes stop_codon:yes gene_type:complete